MNNPSPYEIRQARELAGLSQTSAAALISSTLRTWQDWEAGKARMHPGLWELFLRKTHNAEVSGDGQHPLIVAAVRVATLLERESCAAVAEDTAAGVDAEAIAEAIRARSNAETKVLIPFNSGLF